MPVVSQKELPGLDTTHPVSLTSLIRVEPDIVLEERCQLFSDGPLGCEAARKSMVLDGKIVRYTAVTIPPEVPLEVTFDAGLQSQGFVTHGLLIDQKATEALLGRPPGMLLKEWVDATGFENALAFYPTHFLWQKGQFLIHDGSIIVAQGDKLPIDNDHLSFIGKHAETGKWFTDHIRVRDGVLDPEISPGRSLRDVKIGFSAARILGGVSTIAPYGELINDSRAQADFRNYFDFAFGKDPGNDFWLGLRAVLGNATKEHFYELSLGRNVTISGSFDKTKERELFDNFHTVLKREFPQEYDLILGGGSFRFAVREKLPVQRNPAIGLGTDDEGNLRVVAIDGRQERSAGCTVRELGYILAVEGAKAGSFTCAGGDVALYARLGSQDLILNSPSNPGGETRRVPVAIVFGR